VEKEEQEEGNEIVISQTAETVDKGNQLIQQFEEREREREREKQIEKERKGKGREGINDSNLMGNRFDRQPHPFMTRYRSNRLQPELKSTGKAIEGR